MEPEKISDKHIFLTHGTFSNKKICDGIAKYMTEKGFTCWIMEWRNHGESNKSNHNFNFETIANYDLKSTFNFLFTNQNIGNIDCLAHSGGGIALTILLINNPYYRSKINSITLFGVQAFGAGTEFNNRMKILAGKKLSALLGIVPAKTAGSTEHSENYYTMKQWFNWNLRQNFIGDNGFDYLNKMNEIRVPILSICAKGDSFIAPKIGCEKFLNAFHNNSNKLLFVSKENGNLEDYNHSRILKSQNARKELWPIVAKWIMDRKTITNHVYKT
ncbi:Lysophospholipase, alpha-beta hydrolase superfamily [Aquimarina amphilecti]|uniref:Lysophospholipase, alpha-beta hydrolase superfamily n=1 Tax=Aquimarina amphilecti TaxID=1038014 RepID=A0A1H7MDT6_AQUAM|nr:alpha/beta fold hydrolase [Aquimarina amphilecti]SEL09229.1 Lysophospholipase, alpha-beta hydrolase superfamily [Aquimarina amphilecti]